MASTRMGQIEGRIRRMTPVSAPADQHEEVVALFRLLNRLTGARAPGVPACRIVGPMGESTPVPETVLLALERVVELLGRGDAITVIPVGKDLTTQQAADLLNVSRQYLVRLVDDGRISCIRTGKHRRIRVRDLLAFKRKRDRERRAALGELTHISEELGGYSELG